MSTSHLHPKLTEREASALIVAAAMVLDADEHGSSALPLDWGRNDTTTLRRAYRKLRAVQP